MGLSLGAYLRKPITEKVSCDDGNNRLTICASSMQGWRTTQEDAHNCLLDFDVNAALFAVYDGHGGHEVAQYCERKLPEFIKNTDAYKNNDFDKALIDAFLGFDATIATTEVITELTEIAGAKPTQNLSDDGEDSDVEENVNNLYEEATMPLEQVIEKYTSNLKHPHLQDLQKDGGKQPGSPYLRARRDPPTANEPDVSVAEGSGSSKKISSSSSLDEGDCIVKDVADIKVKPGEICNVTNSVDSNLSNNEEKVDVPLQNGEASSTTGTTETISSKDEKTNNLDEHQENGEICKKRKGKALTKTKGVEKATPIKTRPKRNVQQLYNKLLEFQSESESEDEEDKTFQGPNAADSSSNEDENMNEEEEEEEEEEEDSDSDMDECDLESEEEEDEMLKNMREGPGSDSGCTAVVALLKENQLYVANAGDSRCIVCRNGKAVDMSYDHKPEDDEESQRIIKAGGRISNDGRVNGGLNLSRAIGDHAYKQNKDLSDREQMITALPDVRTLTINPTEDEFMVLACDGIWNVMSSQQVVDFVKSKMEASPKKLSEICEQMFDHCLAEDTTGDGSGCDNMTAIIVLFKSNVNKRAFSNDEESENTKRVKTDQSDATA